MVETIATEEDFREALMEVLMGRFDIKPFQAKGKQGQMELAELLTAYVQRKAEAWAKDPEHAKAVKVFAAYSSDYEIEARGIREEGYKGNAVAEGKKVEELIKDFSPLDRKYLVLVSMPIAIADFEKRYRKVRKAEAEKKIAEIKAQMEEC